MSSLSIPFKSETPMYRSPMTSCLPLGRRQQEETTSLATLSTLSSDVSTQIRSRQITTPLHEQAATGSLPDSSQKYTSAVEKSSRKRVAAYMSLDHVSVADTKGYRIRAAYRMVHYMAWTTGDMQGPGMLSHFLQRDHVLKTPPTKAYMPGMEYVASIFRQMQNLSETGEDDNNNLLTYTLENDQPQSPGFTYLPPPPPDHAYKAAPSAVHYIRQFNGPDNNYNPETDRLLNLWLEAYAYLADYLNIQFGSVKEPEAGVYGTIGMFNADTARFLWPGVDDLIIYESELMLYIFDKLIKYSTRATELEIMEEFGFSRPEAVMLCKSALRYGELTYGEDIEHSKAKEFGSMEAIGDIARKGADPRTQLQVRKQVQLLAGFVRQDANKGAEEFRDLAQRTLDEPEED